jgi:hypothetical protein
VTRPTITPALQLRGAAAGVFTAVLCVAAHTFAGGAVPVGAVIAELMVLAVTVGGVAATLARADDIRVLVSLLAAGQLLGHLLLAITHQHGAAPQAAGVAVLIAHAAAVGVGAVLITAGTRLCTAVARIRRAAVHRPSLPACDATPGVVVGAEQPWRSALLLAASVSHRGPPLGLLT